MGYEAQLIERSAPILVTRPALVLRTLEVATTNLDSLGGLDSIADYLNDPDDEQGGITAPPRSYGFARMADDFGFTVDRFTSYGVSLLDFPEAKLSGVWPFLWDCLAYGVEAASSWSFEGEDGDQWVERLVPGRHTTHGRNLSRGTGGGYVTDRSTRSERHARFQHWYGSAGRPAPAHREPDWPVVIGAILADQPAPTTESGWSW